MSFLENLVLPASSRLLKNSTAIASCSFRDEMLQFLGREKNMLC
jgi:hypothetical protein